MGVGGGDDDISLESSVSDLGDDVLKDDFKRVVKKNFDHGKNGFSSRLLRKSENRDKYQNFRYFDAKSL